MIVIEKDRLRQLILNAEIDPSLTNISKIRCKVEQLDESNIKTSLIHMLNLIDIQTEYNDALRGINELLSYVESL